MAVGSKGRVPMPRNLAWKPQGGAGRASDRPRPPPARRDPLPTPPHPHPLNPHPQTHLCFRYAHGEHELRYVPPEIVAQLEAQQKMQDAGGQRVGSGEGGDRGRGDDSSAAGPGGGAHGGGPGGGHQSFYKTRLCIKYMQTGYCHKGASCTFAHGYEDLRQPGTPISPGRMQQVRNTACPAPPGKQVPADSRRAELGFREVQAELPAGQKISRTWLAPIGMLRPHQCGSVSPQPVA